MHHDTRKKPSPTPSAPQRLLPLGALAAGFGASQPSASLWRSAHSMISRLCSITCPPGKTSTGTVAFGDAASRAGGLFRSATSRSSQARPLAAMASRARIA